MKKNVNNRRKVFEKLDVAVPRARSAYKSVRISSLLSCATHLIQTRKFWVVVCLLASVFWFLSLAPVQAQDITTGLIHYWKFDDGSGTNADDAVGTTDGTLTAGPTWSPSGGRISGAISFADTTVDWVSIADHADYTFNPANSYTWAMWIKPASFDEWSVMWGQELGAAGFFIYAHSGNTNADWEPVTAGISAGTTDSAGNVLALHSSNNVLSAGTWAHVAVTYDGSVAQASRIKIYVNGADVTDTGDIHSVGTIVTFNSNLIQIGKTSFASEEFYGLIDDVRMYSRALSSSDVAELYTYTGACSNPTRNSGSIVYNATWNVMQYCNGSNWKAMGPAPGTGGAGCSSPSRNTGVMIYNSTSNVMQYCDGTNWKAMGPVPGAGGAGCSNPSYTAGKMIYNTDAGVMQYCDGAKWVQVGNP